MHRFELTANCSMTATEARQFFMLVTITSLFVAGVFVSRGYWPILPFAGLELAALGWALHHHWQRAQSWESVEINDESVVLTRWRRSDVVDERVELPTPWTRAALLERGNQLDLAFARGRDRHIFGRFLVPDEKRALQARLAQVLRQTSNRDVDQPASQNTGR
ncbi:MAG: DUF2244 domain-containing protein [Pseudomonadota bacterium]